MSAGFGVSENLLLRYLLISFCEEFYFSLSFECFFILVNVRKRFLFIGSFRLQEGAETLMREIGRSFCCALACILRKFVCVDIILEVNFSFLLLFKIFISFLT